MVLCIVPLGRFQLFCVDIIVHDKLASMNSIENLVFLIFCFL
jgi:hypothetical protein